MLQLRFKSEPRILVPLNDEEMELLTRAVKEKLEDLLEKLGASNGERRRIYERLLKVCEGLLEKLSEPKRWELPSFKPYTQLTLDEYMVIESSEKPSSDDAIELERDIILLVSWLLAQRRRER